MITRAVKVGTRMLRRKEISCMIMQENCCHMVYYTSVLLTAFEKRWQDPVLLEIPNAHF